MKPDCNPSRSVALTGLRRGSWLQKYLHSFSAELELADVLLVPGELLHEPSAENLLISVSGGAESASGYKSSVVRAFVKVRHLHHTSASSNAQDCYLLEANTRPHFGMSSQMRGL